MAIQLISGGDTFLYGRKRASTAMAIGNLVVPDGSGALTNATATTNKVLGPVMRTVATTDADYAQNTLIPFVVITDNTIFLADVGTGTMTQALEGTFCDLKDAGSIDVTATAHNVVYLHQFVSATQALVKFVREV